MVSMRWGSKVRVCGGAMASQRLNGPALRSKAYASTIAASSKRHKHRERRARGNPSRSQGRLDGQQVSTSEIGNWPMLSLQLGPVMLVSSCARTIPRSMISARDTAPPRHVRSPLVHPDSRLPAATPPHLRPRHLLLSRRANMGALLSIPLLAVPSIGTVCCTLSTPPPRPACSFARTLTTSRSQHSPPRAVALHHVPQSARRRASASPPSRLG